MNEQIQEILNSNLKNKQLIDLIINMVDTTQCLSSESKVTAIFTLLDQGGLNSIQDNLMNVSLSINDVNAKLSDLLEDIKHD
ncbi:hypothetical protein [Companilactobacillus hulinensis]|uniref:hypothetical protein n=1 Tax=Companilactobacillus hulinensis TaxID=2486007 RepID=UPI000F797CFD|nr:hypothetical protein [Companilactobacillus hulinensis]